MLDPEACQARCCISRERPQALRHQVWGQFRANGELSNWKACGRWAAGVKRGQRGHRTGILRAKAFGKQGRASFAVEAFTAQADGKTSPLLGTRGCCAGCTSWRPSRPQGHAFPLLPPLKAVQSIGGNSLGMSAATPGRGTQEALRQHEELQPSLLTVAVRHGGQSPCQELVPCVAGCRRHVPEDRSAG